MQIRYDSKMKRHNLIGNTSFTSCHVCYWMNMKDRVEFIRSNAATLACILLCFGPSKNELEKVPTVKLNTTRKFGVREVVTFFA